REENEPAPRRRCEPAASDLHQARVVGPEGAGRDRPARVRARCAAARGGSPGGRQARRVARPRRERRGAAQAVVAARLIDGKALAERIRGEIADEVRELGEIGLATVLVGDDPASDIYIRLKHKAAAEVGIDAKDIRTASQTTEAELLGQVAGLNADESIDGLLVQLPLPDHIDEARVIRAIDPVKDVD